MDMKDRFASLHKRYLIDQHPSLYATMEKTGMLASHLDEIGTQAQAMFDTLRQTMETRAKTAATEAEAQAQLAQIPLIAEEMVMQDLITAPL